MIIVKAWSWSTLLLYVAISCLTAFLFRQSVIAKKNGKKLNIFGIDLDVKILYYLAIYVIFIVFSCFKYSSYEIGGADSLNYMRFFREYGYIKFDIKEMLIFNGLEYLFYNTMYIVKILGGTYRTFLFVVNSVIVLSLIYVVDKDVNDEKKCKGLVLTYLPLLKSLNILRNCVAAFIGYTAVSCVNRNKIMWGIVLVVLAYLNHYVAIVLLAMIVFYKVFPDKWLSKKKLLLALNIICIVISVLSLPLVENVIKKTGYVGYLNNIHVSLLGYVPYIALYILMVMDDRFIGYLKKSGHIGYYKVMVFLSFALPIFVVLNAANRVLLFFEIPIILMAADVADWYGSRIPTKYIKLYNIAVYCVIFGYYIFRIYRMWDGYCLMPYYNILFM